MTVHMDMLSMFIVIYVHVYVCKDCFQICDMLVQDIRKAISWIELNSTSFVISTEWAASSCIRPLPPCFLGTYKRSASAFGWCCPWMVSSFLVFQSSFCSSSWCQLTIPKLYLSTGTANDPVAWILFFALNSVPKISLNLLKYSFFNFSFSLLCCMSKLSSIPKYLYAFLGSSSLTFWSRNFTFKF